MFIFPVCDWTTLPLSKNIAFIMFKKIIIIIWVNLSIAEVKCGSFTLKRRKVGTEVISYFSETSGTASASS